MNNLNWVDYIFIAIFIMSALVGFRRGLAKEITSLATLIAAIIISSLFAERLATTFLNSPSIKSFITSLSTWIGMDASQPVGYLALFLSFCLLFAATSLLGSIISSIISMGFTSLGFVNHLLGGVFGLIRGFILSIIIMFLVQLTPFSTQIGWTQSQLVAQFQPYAARLTSFISPILSNFQAQAPIGMGGQSIIGPFNPQQKSQ